ncbi:MAG: hypothetical protein WAV47_22990 [Blastocatellia bacterium]
MDLVAECYRVANLLPKHETYVPRIGWIGVCFA